MTEHTMQHAVDIGDRGGRQWTPFVAAAAQQFGVQLDQVNGPKFLDWHRADMRNDIKPDDLPIALKG